MNLGGNHSESLAADETGPKARKIALVCGGEFAEHELRNDAIQNGIAKKLEPFVMRAARATVSERGFEECGVFALVVECVLQPCGSGLQCTFKSKQTPGFT